jgi:hypothetical protein
LSSSRSHQPISNSVYLHSHCRAHPHPHPHLGFYDLHDILRRPNIVEGCEWHLNIDRNDNAIRIARKFHQELKKSKPSSSITREIDTIETTFLEFLPTDHKNWKEIIDYFKQARKEDNPIPIIGSLHLRSRSY